MKIVVTTDSGTRLEYEGRDAENMMFFSAIGSDIFHTLPVTCLLKDSFNDLHEYVMASCNSDSFRDMFLKAVVSNTVEDWNNLVDFHYGGKPGLITMTQDLADVYRAKHQDKTG